MDIFHALCFIDIIYIWAIIIFREWTPDGAICLNWTVIKKCVNVS